ncbi:MAG: Rap1a immunity protein [Deltaproteobacteria bacterium]|jgi:hypothetical protein|nr:Rap1a immunity protein [Deltaproteobacteria bacterium]
MKRICKGLIVIAFVFLNSPLVEAQMTGQILVNGWKAFQRADSNNPRMEDTYHEAAYTGFIVGVCDATSHHFNIRSNITPEQALNVVGKYLDEHADRWHESAVVLVLDALEQAFPKFPKKEK